ncbi:hypothetical protein ABZX40_09375 [Streptomyces sp. NPDC004610]|uniref:hypothetical protein n=1 Tax=unclassified Streptomyces TaxID=2593676 RepID=UPI00339DB0CF
MERRQRQRRAGGTGGTSGTVVTGLMACVCLTATGLATAGCSPDRPADRPADRPTPAADPVPVLRGAADALVGAGSSRARTSMEMATGGTRVTIRGEGVYDFTRRLGELRVRLPQDPAGQDERRPITELLAPGALFMKNRGAGVPADKWVRVETASLPDGNLVTGGATDPFAAAEVLRGTREARYVGETEVDGTAVRHYKGTADLTLAAKNAVEGGGGALDAAAKGFATPKVPFEVFLDDAGRIRKVQHRFSYDGGRETGAVAVASTTLLYDFGAPVEVELPERADIYAGRIAEE